MIDIVGKRYWYFGLSLLIIIPGLAALLLFGLPLAIDFSGGSLLDLKFTTPVPPENEIRSIYSQFGVEVGAVQSIGLDGIQIRSREIDDQTRTEVSAELRRRGSEFVELQFSSVSAAISGEVVQQAALTVLVAAAGILLYLWFAFRQVPHAFRYGTAAILSLPPHFLGGHRSPDLF